MSKEVWLRAYGRVYDEHADEGMSEDEMAKLADEKAADMEAALADEAWEMHQETCCSGTCPLCRRG